MDEVTTETVVETQEAVEEQTEVPTQEVEQQEPVEDPLAGLKTALQKERQIKRDLEKRVKQLEQEIADRDKPAEELAVEQARREAEAEVLARANARIAAAEFRVLARERGIDPEVAVRLADLSAVEVGESGDIDAGSLASALDSVIEKFPSLVPSRFQGTADQGARGKDVKPSQLSREDLKDMTPEQVLQADREGRLDRLKGLIK